MSRVFPQPLAGDLELSVRALNALDRAGITDGAKLVEHSASDLMRIANFGRVSLAEVRAELERRGFKLRDDDKPMQSSIVAELVQLRKQVVSLTQEIAVLHVKLKQLSDQSRDAALAARAVHEDIRRRSPYELQAWRGLEYRVQQLERSDAGERLRQ